MMVWLIGAREDILSRAPSTQPLMTKLASTASDAFARYTEMIRAKVHELSAPLSEEQFWRKPYPYGNSFAHLVLHATGNLNYYIGAQIAQTGYVRDRDREFTESERRPKAQVLEAFDDAIDMVVRTIRAQTEDGWSRPYEGKGEPETTDRLAIVLRCVGHAYHHVGQMIYLVKELERQSS